MFKLFYLLIFGFILSCTSKDQGAVLGSESEYWSVSTSVYSNVKVTSITDKRATSNSNNFGPYGLYVNGSYLYVADLYRNRVIRFDNQNNFQGWLGDGSGWSQEVYETLANSTSNGRFNQPHSIDQNCSNEIFITEFGGARVQVFSENGAYLRTIGNSISGGGNLNISKSPSAHFDSSCNFYLTDGVFHRVIKYNNSEVIVGWLGKGVDDSVQATFSTSAQDAKSGSELGAFYQPHVVSFDKNGNLYVVDYNERIQKFDSSGTFVGWIGAISGGGVTTGFSSTGNSVTSSLKGGFNKPTSLDHDSNDNIFAVDFNNHRVQKFDSSGNFVGWLGIGNGGAFTDGWSTSGVSIASNLPGGLNGPTDVVVKDNKIYVADLRNSRVVIYEFLNGSP